MGVLDKLFGDTSETQQRRTGVEQTGETASEDTTQRTTGTTQTGTTSVNRRDQTGQQATDQQQQRDTQQQQEAVTNQQQQQREQSNQQTEVRGRQDQEQSQVGQEQATTSLERLLQQFTQREQTGKQTGRQEGTNVVDQLARSDTVVENLDEATRQSLSALLNRFGGETGALQGFVDMLGERAGASRARIAEQNQDILAAARARGERDIGAARTQLASAVGGSTKNTLVAASAAELENDLTLQLAGLEAQLDQQARAEEREEIDAVLRGFGVQGTTTQQVGNVLAQGRQVARESATSQERGHQTLQSLVDSLTKSTEQQQQQDRSLQQLSQLSQEQLLNTIQDVRKQDQRSASENVLFGETKAQQQTFESQFLSNLVNALTQSNSVDVSDEEVLEVVNLITQEQSDRARVGETTATATTTSETEDGFNLGDVFKRIEELGRA